MKYKKNEAFVDVIESVNLSMSAKGNVILLPHSLIFTTVTLIQARSFTPTSTDISRCEHTFLAPPNANLVSTTNS